MFQRFAVRPLWAILAVTAVVALTASPTLSQSARADKMMFSVKLGMRGGGEAVLHRNWSSTPIQDFDTIVKSDIQPGVSLGVGFDIVLKDNVLLMLALDDFHVSIPEDSIQPNNVNDGMANSTELFVISTGIKYNLSSPASSRVRLRPFAAIGYGFISNFARTHRSSYRVGRVGVDLLWVFKHYSLILDAGLLFPAALDRSKNALELSRTYHVRVGGGL